MGEKFKKTRLDELLVEEGLCGTKQIAQAMIIAKQVKVDSSFVTQPALLVSRENALELVGVKQYVSRGGQ